MYFFDDSYAPMVPLSGLRIMLVVVGNLKRKLPCTDAKVALINRIPDYEVNMSHPEGFVDKINLGYVCQWERAV